MGGERETQPEDATIGRGGGGGPSIFAKPQRPNTLTLKATSSCEQASRYRNTTETSRRRVTKLTRRGKEVETSDPSRPAQADPRHEDWTRSDTSSILPIVLNLDLELRFQSLKSKLGLKVNETTYLRHPNNNGSSAKKVLWADSAGLALTHVAFVCNEAPL
uniref:Uncharacterized protein n=1 Tax=Ananas comosus var. bracteatus TaxID=296719 RepID=A0A6V7NPF0_ANACO|nr:unnamed protein product [Ananas comosus var. bracteatus]